MHSKTAYAVLALGLFLTVLISSREMAKSQRDSDRRQAKTYVIDQTLRSRKGCQRTSARAALTIAYQRATARTRRAAGTPKDLEAADRYDAYATGALDYIPAPKVIASPELMTAATLVEEKGIKKYVLTPRALWLQKQGCLEAYPLP